MILVYDKKYYWRSLCIIGIATAIMYASGGAGFVLLVPFIFSALFTNKAESLFFWLLLTVAMVVGNSVIIPKGIVFAMSQRAALVILGFCMATQIFGGRKSTLITPFLWILPYLLFMACASLQGWSPIVSYLKLFLYTSIYFAYLGVAKRVSESNLIVAKKIRSVVLAFSAFFIFGSILLIPFPGISQLSGEAYLLNPNMTSLFMGMTMHSQSLGPTIAALSTLLFADLLFSVKKLDKLYVAMLLCCPILIFKTSSRTGMATYLVGMGYVAWLFMRARIANQRWKTKMVNIIWGLFVILILMFIGTSGGREGVKKYILKGSSDTEISLETVNSRQGLIDSQLDNFMKKPFFGNGFQVNEETALVNRTSIKDYLTAPVEKGVWVTAALEEGGVIGFILFVSFVFGAIIALTSRKAFIAASCLVVAIVSNLGEFTFFSMSYTGGIVWAVVFAGLVLDIQRSRQERVGFHVYG